jgi:hypothetical protein
MAASRWGIGTYPPRLQHTPAASACPSKEPSANRPCAKVVTATPHNVPPNSLVVTKEAGLQMMDKNAKKTKKEVGEFSIRDRE